jgi:hypothetical protein
MKSHEDTVGHAADASDNPDKISQPGAPISTFFFQANHDYQPAVSATGDAESDTVPPNPVIFGLGVDLNKVSNHFDKEDIPEENLF